MSIQDRINNVDDLIQAKLDYLALITTKLIELDTDIDNIVEDHADYNIDGQQVSWNGYRDSLINLRASWVDAQTKEIAAVEALYDLKNRLNPYQFQGKIR